LGSEFGGKGEMSYEDLKAGGYYGYGYEDAVDEVKDILKKQSFICFNVNEQYSISPIITQKEINGFLKDILDWIFQSSGETTNEL